MTRDMQTTNRYEHSLDSAMRPVSGPVLVQPWFSPDGISRRTRENPCDARSMRGDSFRRNSVRELRTAATWTSRPLRVSVKNLE